MMVDVGGGWKSHEVGTIEAELPLEQNYRVRSISYSSIASCIYHSYS